jgi:hypothetical protein
LTSHDVYVHRMLVIVVGADEAGLDGNEGDSPSGCNADFEKLMGCVL